MNIVTIGDLHGSTAWKSVDPGKWDKMVFIGDYVDSFYFGDDHIYNNLVEVIELKKRLPVKVVLLWGNHDLAYLFQGNSLHYCSGFRDNMLEQLFDLFIGNRDLFQAAFQVENYLWTHAGLINQWFKTYVERKFLPADVNIAGTLNRLFDDYYRPLFHVSFYRGGREDYGGIFWADMNETLEDPLWDYHQIIGHTKTGNGILTYESEDKGTSLTYCDCLDSEVEFYELSIDIEE